MIQVVAHFHDLQSAFSAAAEHTRPGGHWLIETWNCRSLKAARFFGSEWHEYSPPSVLQWFTPTSLERLSSNYQRELNVSRCERPPEKIYQRRTREIVVTIPVWAVSVAKVVVTICHSAAGQVGGSLSFRRPLLVVIAERSSAMRRLLRERFTDSAPNAPTSGSWRNDTLAHRRHRYHGRDRHAPLWFNKPGLQ